MNVPRPSGTCAMPRRTMVSVATPSMRAPANCSEPSVRIMPQMARNVVVLPAPLAPSSAVTPPSSTTKSRPCKTLVSPYHACRPDASSSAGIVGLAQVSTDDFRFVAHRVGGAVGDLHAEFQRHHLVGHIHHQAHV